MSAGRIVRSQQLAWATRRGILLQKGNPRSCGDAFYTQSLCENLFEPLGAEARLHEQEAIEFSRVLACDGVRFHALTWQDLIRRLVDGEKVGHPKYTTYLRDRYLAGL